MAEQQPVSEAPVAPSAKQRLDPRVAFVLMVIMIICSLCIGANKAWKKQRVNVDTAFSAWEENLQMRVETCYNLLTVAGRYLPQSDALCAAVRADLKAMENASLALEDRAAAAARFEADANALLAALAADSAVMADSRDAMYVTSMLPQAVEQSAKDTAAKAYNTAAESYNGGLHSFSGLLARLTGVGFAEVISLDTGA